LAIIKNAIKNRMKNKLLIGFIIFAVILFIGYLSIRPSEKDKLSEEQITISSSDETSESTDTLLNSVTGNVTMKQISTFPNKVILTGMNEHRLVSIYKSKPLDEDRSRLGSWKSYDQSDDEANIHFMPGIDILFGYNLLNIAHYDLTLEKGNFLFNHPVLIKTLYYPSFSEDSVDKKPINRNYYLVSVYDEDTNKDTLINKKDLRRFYHFDATGGVKIQIIPPNYSVIRSQYDSKNDLMYIFASLDENKNGTQEKTESIHIFWFSLKKPEKAKLLY
jgi:hypothetical protein